jgi:hypothetical protein
VTPARAGGSGVPAPRVDGCPAADERRAVAVVSDGSALRGDCRQVDADALGMLLEDDAAGIRARAGLPVRAAPLPTRDVDDLVAHLPGDAGAIFLTHTDPARARTVQRQVREAGGPPVLTDADTVTVTLTAALLTTLASVHCAPEASRVIIAGAAALPELTPLLIATGIGDISGWHASDAHAFPLRHLARHATAVIDLLGTTKPPTGWIPGDRWSGVISPDDPTYRLLPVPGVCTALVRHPDATLDLDVFRACALAMAVTTPPGDLVPDLDNPHLTEAIASPVLRVLARRPSTRAPRPPA